VGLAGPGIYFGDLIRLCIFYWAIVSDALLLKVGCSSKGTCLLGVTVRMRARATHEVSVCAAAPVACWYTPRANASALGLYQQALFAAGHTYALEDLSHAGRKCSTVCPPCNNIAVVSFALPPALCPL
jgi:hypothetical protein